MIENLADALRLMLVTDDALLRDRDLVDLCAAAVAGGVTSVQLRLKRAADRDLLTHARRLVQALNVPVFVNDRLDVAIAAGAAGAHLGPDDLFPERARRIAPPGFVIGASVGSDSEVERAVAADYWGIGPLHGSATKIDAGAALGWEGAGRLLARAGMRPCVIIGGVTPGDVEPAHEHGFAGVAVVSGILSSDSVVAAARAYRRGGGEV